MQLAGLLAERGNLDRATQILSGHDPADDGRLADLLIERGDLDEAIQILRGRADAGDRYAAIQLVSLLIERGDLDEAIQILRSRADAGDVSWLAELLARQGHGEEAERLRRYGLNPDGAIARPVPRRRAPRAA